MNMFLTKRKLVCAAFACLLLTLAFAMAGCKKEQTTAQPETLKSVQDLANQPVAVLTGTVYDFYLQDHHLDQKVLRLNSPAEMLTAVEKGNAQFAIIDSVQILNVDLEEHSLEIVLTLPDCSGDAAVAFAKESTALCEQFNAFLKAYQASGQLDSLNERWSTKKLDTVTVRKQKITQGEPLVVGANASNMPFSLIKDNEWTGFEVEMMQDFGDYIGRPVHFDNYEFTGLIAAVNSHRVDAAICFMFITEERAQQVLFSDPYYHCIGICIDRIADNSPVAQKGFGPKIVTGFQRNFIQEERWKLLVDGFVVTIVISLFSLLFGTILGAGLCYLRMNKRAFWRGLAKVYIDLMRGIPILVFLMVLFYVVFASTALSGSVIAIIAFSLNLAAYVCEMFRTGIESVDKGQTEAGRALGFGKTKTFFLIVVPQALKQILPVYKGEAISLIKNTSVVGYIAIQDMTKVSDIIRSRTFDAFYPLIVISIIYFLMAWLLGKLLDYLCKKTSK